MSARITLSSKLPGDPEINGLDARADWLEDNPDELLVCIVYLDTPRVTIDTETGTHVPTVRVRRIEPLGAMSDVPTPVREAMADAEAERTGRTPLPFEIVVPPRSADPHGDELPEGDD